MAKRRTEVQIQAVHLAVEKDQAKGQAVTESFGVTVVNPNMTNSGIDMGMIPEFYLWCVL